MFDERIIGPDVYSLWLCCDSNPTRGYNPRISVAYAVSAELQGLAEWPLDVSLKDQWLPD